MVKEIKSSCFTFYHFEKFTKNIMRIMRTRCSFGMELHAEDRFVFHSQTFERVIVQTFVGDFHFVFIQIAFGDAVIMILRSDKNFADWQILNGMISAVMTKLETVCIRSKRAPDELMSETNSKDRHAAFDQSAHGFDGVGQTRRVARSVREKDSVRFQCQHFIRSCIRRDNGHIRAVMKTR